MSIKIKSIISSWTQFDIKKVQHELDDNVIEIAQKLEEGDASRKSLIEKTKEFRRNLSEEERKLVGPILKQFQLEVDSSNKRSKLMEQILLGLYKQLIDLPDPNPALENAEVKIKKAEKMQDLEMENKQLKTTLDEYHEEFAHVKNQEVTLKALKDRIKELESVQEQTVQQRLKEKEKELQKSYGDKEESLRDNQLDLVKKLGETENRNLECMGQLEKCQNELYDLKQQQDEMMSAKTGEMDMLLLDLDKLTERAVNAERLADQHQKSLETSTHNSLVSKGEDLNAQKLEEIKLTSYRVSSLEVELVAKEKEISQLVNDVQKLHMNSNKGREFHESQRAQMEERLAKREKKCEELEVELAGKVDYEKVKRELNVLKMIEFSHFESSVAGGEQPLEILLLEKNRVLQNENTVVKNRLGEQDSQLEIISKEHSDLKKTNTELHILVAELEKDLHKVARNQASSSSNTHNHHQSTVLNLENQPSVTNQLENQPDNNNQQQQIQTNDSYETTTSNNQASLFDIVSNQRERFKIRCLELESDNIAAKQQNSFLTNELDQLRSDNVKLYEKIRYLQSAGKLQKVDKYKQSDIESYDADTDENVLRKYTSAYESRLDPFNKFSYREKQRRYTNLKLHDKFTLNFGRFILSNSTSRLIFCLYLVVMHLLIFFNLYHMAHHTSATRDLSAECAHAYKHHMAQVHGNSDFHID